MENNKSMNKIKRFVDSAGLDLQGERKTLRTKSLRNALVEWLTFSINFTRNNLRNVYCEDI